MSPSAAVRVRELLRSERFRRASVWAVVLLALVIRLYGAWHWNLGHPDSPDRLVGDEPGFDSMARELLRGEGVKWPGRVPLYPAFLAGMFLLTGGSYSGIPYLQAFLGACTVYLTYGLGRRMFGHGVGLIAAMGAATSYVLIQQGMRLLSEPLYTPILLLTAIGLWDALEKPTALRLAWAGLLVGISNLIRPALLLFPLAALALFLFHLGRKRRTMAAWALYAGMAVAVVLPWTIRNYQVYDAIFPLQTSNAILWQGSPEYYRLVRHEGYTYLQIWTEVLYGPGWEAHDPNSIEGDRYWTKRAVRSILAEPHIYALFFVEKLATFWVGDPNADWGDTYVFNYDGLWDWLPRRDAVQLYVARLLPVFALLAAVFLRKEWRRLAPIYVVLLYFTLLHAATHSEARLSEPLQPILLILIAAAVVELLRRGVRHRAGKASSRSTVASAP